MDKKTLAAGVAALAVVFTAAACSDSDTGTTTAAPSSVTATSPAEEAVTHNQADVMFARMMIPHHAQAIEMSDMILAKEGIPAEVTALAEQIKAAQGPEIEQLESWLDQGGRPQMPTDAPGAWQNMPGMTSMPMQSMPMQSMPMQSMPMQSMPGMQGMMSAEDMQALSAAQGTEAARLFLTQMIVHHQGAIAMAQTEVENGQSPDTVALAHNIIDAQQQEIDTMRQLLTTL
ncbi:DUF305 domain-containing protein [Rhodococcus sp. HM1]|uniref:DUF305 domain-containing protein n=1 Tax=Rhodococcus sp. HM1 TaxID=2937759 RepID=UPI00200A47FD|nr:DUF305 domain-containing protein [Rhodococcus sp. HM1]MCK8672428.1 DUF305 domain-containing protein [Rhodococcus sp. HM1]